MELRFARLECLSLLITRQVCTLLAFNDREFLYTCRLRSVRCDTDVSIFPLAAATLAGIEGGRETPSLGLGRATCIRLATSPMRLPYIGLRFKSWDLLVKLM